MDSGSARPHLTLLPDEIDSMGLQQQQRPFVANSTSSVINNEIHELKI